MKRVLITGITGFIGSHIGHKLNQEGYEIYALHRSSSTFDKCSMYINDISLINIDNSNWEQEVFDIKADIFIHTAWSGITTEHRNNWEFQMDNFWFSKKIFDLAVKSNAQQVIALGSQAEYGVFNLDTNEESLPCPLEAYESIKLLNLNYLKSIFQHSETKWHWIRIFTVFGQGENETMLIPSTIKKLLKSETIDLTECLQEYNYLYIEDFIKCFFYLLQPALFPSGIYNICNTKTESIQSVLIKIANLLGKPVRLLNFGKLPYRKNQRMKIIGNPTKFNSVLKNTEQSFDIYRGLEKTINSIKAKYEGF